MLGAVDPAAGFGVSTSIFYSEVAISLGVNPPSYGKVALQVLSLTTIARGFSYHCGSASDLLSSDGWLAISLRAPSGDYLIANSPFRHLQEPWHDAAPLRSPCRVATKRYPPILATGHSIFWTRSPLTSGAER